MQLGREAGEGTTGRATGRNPSLNLSSRVVVPTRRGASKGLEPPIPTQHAGLLLGGWMTFIPSAPDVM